MPARKKTRKKQTKTESASKKKNPSRKQLKAAGGKTKIRPKKSLGGKQKSAAGKPSAKKAVKHTSSRKTRNRNRVPDQIPARVRLQSDSEEEAGDLQGLGRLAEADSESARELLEEGNAFEADVVSGVEAAGDKPGREVRTRQVPEDDVPEEYLDNE